MRRSPMVRALSALLLLLYGGGQPATLCAVDCLLQRHGAHPAAHAAHHHETAPTQPCHTGAIGAPTTPPSAITAVPAVPPDVGAGLVAAADVTWLVSGPAQTPLTRSLPLDTPPPRG